MLLRDQFLHREVEAEVAGECFFGQVPETAGLADEPAGSAGGVLGRSGLGQVEKRVQVEVDGGHAEGLLEVRLIHEHVQHAGAGIANDTEPGAAQPPGGCGDVDGADGLLYLGGRHEPNHVGKRLAQPPDVGARGR